MSPPDVRPVVLGDWRGERTAATVGKREKLLARILQGSSDATVHFGELRALLLWLGFRERVRGSHHIFQRPGIEAMINLQRDGNMAKPYQVRQVRGVIWRHRLMK